jgi:hypothetical protein
MTEDTGAGAPSDDRAPSDDGGQDTPTGAAEAVLQQTDGDAEDADALAAERDATTESHFDERLRGWGGNPDAPPLSDAHVARLQEHDEPVAAGNFGAALSGDLGNAEVADETTDAPETVEPDTSLGHEGGRRYEDFAGDAGADGSA